jgi:hypothetical protein
MREEESITLGAVAEDGREAMRLIEELSNPRRRLLCVYGL